MNFLAYGLTAVSLLSIVYGFVLLWNSNEDKLKGKWITIVGYEEE